MRKILFVIATMLSCPTGFAQTPKTYTSSEILLQLKKLNVLGSVLYIAAHPDDENTRLLAYLANEKLYRTGYLSLTRGDGGQNLIGDEQGIDLGLIRTQELLSARRIDGAEQFFSRAYDFGFSKSSDEALKIWGHDKILSDVVWVIRKFRPDVIITRFPGDARAGHGHHAASAILAREAFDAAADSTKFPEQLSKGVTVWQAKRILWNTFNFGNTNTQSEDQFKLDVGMYNPLLGRSYGEMAALSRSQHKSQGFGVPAQRGTALEYFATTGGDKPVTDLLEGVNTDWQRVGNNNIANMVAHISRSFLPGQPERSVSDLVRLYRNVDSLPDSYWKKQKLKEIQNCIEATSGLYLEATAGDQYGVEGDSLKISVTANNRLGLSISAVDVHLWDSYFVLNGLRRNENVSFTKSIYLAPGANSTQPYWLAEPMDKGSFNVSDQQKIGRAENEPPQVSFKINIEGIDFTFNKPVRFKYTDPVRGELYQPISVIPAADLKFDKDLYLVRTRDSMNAQVRLSPNIDRPGNFDLQTKVDKPAAGATNAKDFIVKGLFKEKPELFPVRLPASRDNSPLSPVLHAVLDNKEKDGLVSKTYKRIISYDHIPLIVYQKEATAKFVNADLKTDGKLVGYIPGAGDKVQQALAEMGYRVVVLNQKDIRGGNLSQFDAIITGVRAYNVNEWMNDVYGELMDYVKDGGVLLTQYNTSSQVGPVRAKISPYPFNISRNRITDEDAAVSFLLPDHPVLNYPNKITPLDFEGWIQERSIYNAEKIDSNYQRVLAMKDPGEGDQDGSLIIANYGKGKFVYTGLVFFRELPAGVPGAYRLFANIIALNKTGQRLKPAKPSVEKMIKLPAKKTTANVK